MKIYMIGLLAWVAGCGVGTQSTSDINAIYRTDELNAEQMWRVTADGGLNCRLGPGTEFDTVNGALPEGTLLIPVPNRRGGVEVDQDRQGRNWLKVAPVSGSDRNLCFVLAESRYIQPARRIITIEP